MSLKIESANRRESLRVLCLGSKRERGKKELQSVGVNVYSIPHGLQGLEKLVFLRKLMEKVKPHVILTDSPGFSVASTYLFGKCYGIPSFIWLRGDFEEEYRETLTSYENFLEKVTSTLKLQASKLLVKRTTAIFTVSNYLRDKVTRQLKMPGKNITSIYPSVNLKRFNPSHNSYAFKKFLGLGQDERLLLSVANFRYPLKVAGLLYFLDSIADLLRKDKTLRYVIAGEGPLRNVIESKVRKPKSSRSIILPGFVKEIEIAYAAADLVVHTSFLDAFPLSVLEASASGRPVIVNNSGGLPESVVDGTTGFIVGQTNGDELKEKIIEILENDELRYEMGLNARRRAEQLFGREKIGELLRESIERFL